MLLSLSHHSNYQTIVGQFNVLVCSSSSPTYFLSEMGLFLQVAVAANFNCSRSWLSWRRINRTDRQTDSRRAACSDIISIWTFCNSLSGVSRPYYVRKGQPASQSAFAPYSYCSSIILYTAYYIQLDLLTEELARKLDRATTAATAVGYTIRYTHQSYCSTIVIVYTVDRP